MAERAKPLFDPAIEYLSYIDAHTAYLHGLSDRKTGERGFKQQTVYNIAWGLRRCVGPGETPATDPLDPQELLSSIQEDALTPRVKESVWHSWKRFCGWLRIEYEGAEAYIPELPSAYFGRRPKDEKRGGRRPWMDSREAGFLP